MYVVAYRQVPGGEHQHKIKAVSEERPVVNFWILQDKKRSTGCEGVGEEIVISYLIGRPHWWEDLYRIVCDFIGERMRIYI